MYAALILFAAYSVVVTVLFLLALAGAFQGLYVRYHTFFLDRQYRKILDDAFIQDSIRKAGSNE